MLAEFKTPLNFWAEAISTACHSSNWLYFRKKLDKTAYELLTGNKLNVSYFRVFGCKCLYLRKGVCVGGVPPGRVTGSALWLIRVSGPGCLDRIS